MGRLLLGVDGGNTKTIAVVARADGAVAGCGAAGCSDIHSAASSPQDAIGEISSAVTAALTAADAGARELSAACFSLAGADWPEDFELLRRELTSLLALELEPQVVNDAIGALRSGTLDGVGVSVACGTGGAIGARNAEGAVFHLGFWPDDTGAHALGSEALAAVWRAGLGIGPATSLTCRALARWRAADALELLHAFTRRGGLESSERSRFAEAVLDEAAAGDDVAREIVASNGARLGSYARVAATRTGQAGSPFPLVLCGGVLRHPSSLLRESIVACLPEAVPVCPAVEPVIGAVLLAADSVGARPSLEELHAGSRALGAA